MEEVLFNRFQGSFGISFLGIHKLPELQCRDWSFYREAVFKRAVDALSGYLRILLDMVLVVFVDLQSIFRVA